ncbi:MAG: putative F420-dependent oxidoreductase [Frankiales bacterium]|nr:putative F420-dependent oxidoreductase [Frankiales bacterium]
MTVIQLSASLPSFAEHDPGPWTHLFDHARLLDQAGFDRMVLSDHVVFGERLDEYGRPEIGGQRGGQQPTGPDGHWLEPLTTLAVLAGMTSRIRLGTSILLAALRRPVVLAKCASTLDVLSGGRLDLGVGVGWQREEYEAAGVPFSERGRRLDHTLEVCQALWTQQRASYDSAELAFSNIHMMPKPVQPGNVVPFWISGTNNARVVTRLARFGAGWIPWGDAAAELSSSVPRMRDALAREGADPDALQVVGHLRVRRHADRAVDVSATLDGLAPLLAAGVTDVRVHLPLPEQPTARLQAAADFVAAFREATGRPAATVG